MWKRPLIISSIIVLIGILIMFYYAYSWKFVTGYWGFFVGAYSVIIIVVVSSMLLISTIAYTIFSWKKESIASFLPLIVLIIMIFLSSFSILPSKFMKSYQRKYFEANFKQYSEAASIMDKVSVKKGQEEYRLPFRYRYLSEGGKIRIYVNDHKEIVFFLRRGIGAGEFLVYTPTDEILFKNNKHTKVTKKRKNWYYVEEY